MVSYTFYRVLVSRHILQMEAFLIRYILYMVLLFCKIWKVFDKKIRGYSNLDQAAWCSPRWGIFLVRLCCTVSGAARLLKLRQSVVLAYPAHSLSLICCYDPIPWCRIVHTRQAPGSTYPFLFPSTLWQSSTRVPIECSFIESYGI